MLGQYETRRVRTDFVLKNRGIMAICQEGGCICSGKMPLKRENRVRVKVLEHG